MSNAKNGDTVKVHYTGKLEDGTVFDSSKGGQALEFTLGEGRTIPGFEEALIGMEPGESKAQTISPEKAYGQKNEELLIKVDRSDIPQDIQPEIGLRMQVSQQDGNSFPVTIAQVTDDHVTLDANHPLAGKTLVFDIELVEIV